MSKDICRICASAEASCDALELCENCEDLRLQDQYTGPFG